MLTENGICTKKHNLTGETELLLEASKSQKAAALEKFHIY